MESWVYLIIAICLIILLIVIFFVSYFLNKKTSIPKSCENLMIDEANCKACQNFDCELRKKELDKDSSKN